MKIAVSIPDDVFKEAERLARRLKKSRSGLYSHAISEYVARHSKDSITEGWNRVSALNESEDKFVSTASRRILEKSEW